MTKIIFCHVNGFKIFRKLNNFITLFRNCQDWYLKDQVKVQGPHQVI